MKHGFCKFVEHSIWKYIDRELSARNLAEISGHLATCASCKKLYETRAREATMYRLAFMGSPFGAEFCEKYEEAILAEVAETPVGEPRGEVLGFLSRWKERPGPVLVAALVLAVVTLFAMTFYRLSIFSSASRDGGLARDARSVTPSRESDASRRTLGIRVLDDGSEQRAFYAGERYTQTVNPSVTTFQLDDGSSLTFAARPWELFVQGDSGPNGSFTARVDEGVVDVSVTKRAADRSFTLQTPNAEVRVLGTEFTLEVRMERGQPLTWIEVTEGRVRVTDVETDRVYYRGPDEGRLRIPLEDSPAAALEGAGADDTDRSRTRDPASLDLDRPVSIPR